MVVTPSVYGAYELANLCLLRGDDEVRCTLDEDETDKTDSRLRL